MSSRSSDAKSFLLCQCLIGLGYLAHQLLLRQQEDPEPRSLGEFLIIMGYFDLHMTTPRYNGIAKTVPDSDLTELSKLLSGVHQIDKNSKKWERGPLSSRLPTLYPLIGGEQG